MPGINHTLVRHPCFLECNEKMGTMGTNSMFLEGATRGMQAGMAEIITHFFKAWRLLQKNLRHIASISLPRVPAGRQSRMPAGLRRRALPFGLALRSGLRVGLTRRVLQLQVHHQLQFRAFHRLAEGAQYMQAVGHG